MLTFSDMHLSAEHMHLGARQELMNRGIFTWLPKGPRCKIRRISSPDLISRLGSMTGKRRRRIIQRSFACLFTLAPCAPLKGLPRGNEGNGSQEEGSGGARPLSLRKRRVGEQPATQDPVIDGVSSAWQRFQSEHRVSPSYFQTCENGIPALWLLLQSKAGLQKSAGPREESKESENSS